MNKLKAAFFPHDHKEEHFKALDGLRGIAVLFVIFSHSSNNGVYLHEYLNLSGMGKVGVYLFFVLSAYLLDRQIAIILMSGRSSFSYWKNYFFRRFMRIYPLFIIALFVQLGVSSIGIAMEIESFSEVIEHIFLLKGESIFWSIAVEFKYYFVSPLIMFFCHKVLKWNPLYTLLFLIGVIFMSIAFKYIFDLYYISTIRFFPVFLVGTIISIFELLLKQKKSFDKYKKSIEIAGLIGFAMILCTIPYYFKLVFGVKPKFHTYAFYLPYSICWAALLVASKYGVGYIRKTFELNFLRFIGVISYSVYLFHLPILYIINASTLPQNIKIYPFLILTLLISSVTYLVLERPLAKIKLYKKEVRESMIIKKR